MDGADQKEAPIAVARLAAPRRRAPPEIVFPRDGVEIFTGPAEQGVALAARGGAGGYRWYVAGEEIAPDASGRAFWRPAGPGFYEISVVDSAGRAARAKIRVAAG
jgi:penicillin-binding protein 1C